MKQTSFLRTEFLMGIFILLVIPFFSSCVLFDDPQPVDAKTLRSFPKALWGIRTIKDDTLMIDKTSLTVITNESKTIALEEINGQSEYRIENNKIYNFEFDSAIGFDFTVAGDSVYFSERRKVICELSDTIVIENDRFIIKTFKKFLFINMFHEGTPGYWELYWADLRNKDFITVRKLSQDEGKGKLQAFLNEFPEEEDNSIHFTSDFTRRTITEYIKQGGFTDTLLILTPEYILDKNH